jgi:hypothetical protein
MRTRFSVMFTLTLPVLFMSLKDFTACSDTVANNRCLCSISHYSIGFMGQTAIQNVAFLHTTAPTRGMKLYKESALFTFYIYQLHISHTFSRLIFGTTLPAIFI